MTQEQILEILDSYKLRISPTVFYDLKADIVNYEEQEPTTNCGQMMDFPQSFDDFVKDYGFRDKKEIYTNGSELIPVFRVKQWLEHIQEPQTFKWCTDCREYDQEKHCCHRWSKVIRDTVEEMKQEPKTGHWRPIYQGDEIIDYRCSKCEFGNTFGKSTHGMNYCPHCGAKMESEET